jgi:CheY-like chemotaxis protein
MRLTGRILIVDDDQDFLAVYRELFRDEGYDVDTATTRDQALELLDSDDWDVVLLDQKLLGPGSPDHGIDLAHAVRERAPGAKVIFITAYASRESIERAYAAGVYEFLEKLTPQFEHLLRVKVRNAMEAVRERKLGALRDQESAQRIDELWQSFGSESDSHRKGRVLEELMLLVLRSIPGFRHVSEHRSSEDEEIDIVVRNESTDPIWSKESPYLLVECKNWSRPVPAREFDRFQSKLERRYGRARLGLFVAAGGFTAGFHTERQAERKGDVLVTCIGPEDLAELVMSRDRNETLKAFHDRAVVEGKGKPG